MGKMRVTFELVNGKSHLYKIDSDSDKIYALINNSPDGWIELNEDGETHYIKEGSIVRVRVESEAEYNAKQEKSQRETSKAISEMNF
ncbi:hypothetical protein [Paraliobacillus sediminis]|uniref:hypothetical protein n=1 Tax=Paraliobacillus sediminis TaxID=1885916 RepID=UPI000E3BEB70|nr:hypothetical protein [Paraliobacillus sediminis]